jgi:hypothetical protein
MDTKAVMRRITEDDLMVLLPYRGSISIMQKHGTHLVYAKHDGADEGGDIENLKTLCLLRFNQGEQS